MIRKSLAVIDLHSCPSALICAKPDTFNWIAKEFLLFSGSFDGKACQKLSLCEVRAALPQPQLMFQTLQRFPGEGEARFGPDKSQPRRMSYLFMRDMPWLGNVCQASRWGGHQ